MNGNVYVSKKTKEIITKYDYIPKDNIRFTSIIILTHNKLEYTQLCIESVRKFTPKGIYEIIVVDNNSKDSTLEWLSKQDDIKVIDNSENLGFPVGCNQGINIAKGESILLLNNDTIVTPNWLNNMDRALYSNSDIGAVGAITNNCSNMQQIKVEYQDIYELLEFVKGNNISNPELWVYKTYLVGFCYLIKKDVINEIGLLDERFSPGNFEDTDLSMRVLLRGYKLLLCKDAFIHHYGSISFKEDIEKFSELLTENCEKFKDKWGFDIRYSNSTRFDLIEMINEEKDKKINVLDIGCGIGATLLELKNKFRNADIYAVEICKDAAKISKTICNTIVGDIEEIELKDKENFFDYIILGDVIEDLKNPWETLRKIRTYLKDEGFVIASIANMMHVKMLRSIIYGKFTYSDIGLPNKNHLRFFTLYEIQKLFEDNEYILTNIESRVVPIESEDYFFIRNLCKISSDKLEEQFCAFSYNIKAEKGIDVAGYNECMKTIKYRLLRVSNSIGVEDNLNYIFEVYKKYEKYKYTFASNIYELINSNCINKNKVLNILRVEARNRNLLDLEKLLEEDIYEQ